MRRVVLELASVRPIWSVPAGSVTAIREAFGAGWEVISIASPSSSDGDGAGGSAEAVEAAAGAEVYMGWGAAPAVVRKASGTLRWLHTAAAGVGGSLTNQLHESGATFTNSSGVHAEPMADWVLAALGFCARGFHAAVGAQARREWTKDAFTDGSLTIRELGELRLGLVGLGGVGRAIARRALALGLTVRAIRRRPDLSCPAGIAWVGGAGDIIQLAQQSDALIITAPRTAETHHIVNGAVLDALPDGAHVLNVARGDLVDEAALLQRLDTGKLGGCVLDVFATEPLPEDHPFWTHPAVFVTPHVSAVSDRFWKRETSLILDNVRRYLAGHPLENVVDFESGY